jgi:hypothetical protein
MNPPPGPDFQVAISAATRELLVRLRDEAARDGRRDEFLAALRHVSTQLRTDPVTYGEEVFDLRQLRLTVKVGVLLPLAVEFAAYPERRPVFVRTFRYVRPG